MAAKYCLIVLFVFFCHRICAKQLSEIKCEETAELVTNSRSLYPHLIEIVKLETDGSTISMCHGSLISENYVLTSAYCTRYGQWQWKDLRVRKLKLPGELYSNSQLFSIYRYIPHQLYDDTIGIYNDIGLLHLNESIPYHKAGSIFRPACLWTNSLLRASYKYSLYGHELYDNVEGGVESRMIIKQAKLITNDECNLLFEDSPDTLPDGIIHSHMCVNSSDPIDTEFFGEKGTKISRFIKWIEPIVWARNKNVISPAGCGERKVRHKPLITYGLPSYHGEFPWHVALYRVESSQHRKYICGGTIINNRTVLTAAHCVHNESGHLEPNRLKVVAGIFQLNQVSLDSQHFDVEMITVHEEFTRDYLENDIALLKLNCIINFTNYIQPICITDNSDYYSITIGTIAGWGRDEYNEQSDVIQQATLPIRINSECRDSNRDFFPNYLNDNNYCAGYENGTNVCSGDSGGGMIFEHASRWYIRGIVSLGVALPNSDRCDVYQMVLFTDVPKFYDWIVEYLEKN